MTFFEEFFSNHIFLTAACGWFVAQILKTLIHLIISKKFVAERLVGSGGMPSSHSATVCALVTATCYEYGAGSFEFAISDPGDHREVRCHGSPPRDRYSGAGAE